LDIQNIAHFREPGHHTLFQLGIAEAEVATDGGACHYGSVLIWALMAPGEAVPSSFPAFVHLRRTLSGRVSFCSFSYQQIWSVPSATE
jgi:hypothetical protein